MYEWPKISNLGEGTTSALFEEKVVVEEKIDGSNISIMFDYDFGIKANSRRGIIDIDNPPASCRNGIAHLINVSHMLSPNVTYFFECRDSVESHHTPYKRTPLNGLVLLDIVDFEDWYTSGEKQLIAKALSCDEPYITELESPWSLNKLADIIDKDSMLGNNMEGVVVKTIDKPERIMAKLVRDEYIEYFIPNVDESVDNISSIVAEIRFEKVVQKMLDAYELKNDRSDIGKIITVIWKDICDEESEKLSELTSNQFATISTSVLQFGTRLNWLAGTRYKIRGNH